MVEVLKIIGVLFLIYVCLAFSVIKFMLARGYHVPKNSEINAYIGSAKLRLKEEREIRTFARNHNGDISSQKKEPHERERLKAGKIRRLR